MMNGGDGDDVGLKVKVQVYSVLGRYGKWGIVASGADLPIYGAWEPLKLHCQSAPSVILQRCQSISIGVRVISDVAI